MLDFIFLMYILPCIIGLLWFLNFSRMMQNLSKNEDIIVQKIFGSFLSIGLIISILYSISNLDLLPYIK